MSDDVLSRNLSTVIADSVFAHVFATIYNVYNARSY